MRVGTINRGGGEWMSGCDLVPGAVAVRFRGTSLDIAGVGAKRTAVDIVSTC